MFIFSIHFVNTHLRPDSFPMDMVIFTGVESEEEFKKKRPLEYKRLAAQGKLEAKLGEAPQTWQLNFSKVIGFTAILIGLTLLVLTLERVFQLTKEQTGAWIRVRVMSEVPCLLVTSADCAPIALIQPNQTRDRDAGTCSL